jgi:uncharacterized integral membrane protein
MRCFKTLLWMAVILFFILFAKENHAEVTLRFSLSPVLDRQWIFPPVPLFVAILCSVLLGALIGGVTDFLRGFKLRRSVAQHQKTIERLEREIQSLRKPQGD